MTLTTRIVATALLLTSIGRPLAADGVAEWIDRTVATGYRSNTAPPLAGRNLTLVAVAMFEALNSITPRYRSYRAQPAAPAGASADAAIAAAAHYLLVRMYPEQAGDLDAAFQTAVADVADAGSRARGVALGERIAAALWEECQSDGALAANTYRPMTAPGAYVPTALPAVPWWGSVRPFVLRAGNQFRPGAPYALSSAQWAADYNEVKRLGGKAGSARTAEQTEIARFWEYTGPGTYMPVALRVAEARRLDPLESARLFALAAMAASDALVAVFDAKYAFGFWRPITAIRNGDQDGNDATERDLAWEPLINTPMHPEYPCAHCITQTAVATVLSALGGDSVSFALTSPTAPGVTRRYARLSDYAAEVLNARVYDGVHYRTSGEVGAAMGRQIGTYVVEHALTAR